MDHLSPLTVLCLVSYTMPATHMHDPFYCAVVYMLIGQQLYNSY